ncbi:hypothetical protein [Rhizobium giardinii]|uniref:Alpha/beta hydrolase n=1 Tax=Rhizobium giardinii TaxID=56731 RepID=A0A7W8XB07_9HYPH|nr:hypothetical protein [Rhizobium giardinii]MBB5538789.1 hypothetical protein [Rhizobium giardinii]
MDEFTLFPREKIKHASATPLLYFYREPATEKAPLVVFIPGAGHRARIAYGVSTSRPEDFLDYWLEQQGYGFLAISAPSHPLFDPALFRDLTIERWSDAIAETITDVAGTSNPPEIILCVWSLASAFAGHIASCLKGRGIDVSALIPLAASAPLPRPGGVQGLTERTTEIGLWNVADSLVNGVRRGEIWEKEIAEIEAELGRLVISPDAYAREILTATPIGLVPGGFERNSGTPDQKLPSIPLAAPIVPTDAKDYRHALSDQQGWSYMNCLLVIREYSAAIANGMHVSDEAWAAISHLTAKLPSHLCARVQGGHFLFVGERGAKETALAIVALRQKSKAFKSELGAILAALSK